MSSSPPSESPESNASEATFFRKRTLLPVLGVALLLGVAAIPSLVDRIQTYREPDPIRQLFPTDLDSDADDELLVFRQDDHRVSIQAIDDSGTPLWRRRLPRGVTVDDPSPLRRGVIRSDDTVIFSLDPDGQNGGITAFSLTSREILWRAFTDTEPVAYSFYSRGDMVVAKRPEGNLVALDTATGEQLWRREFDHELRAVQPASNWLFGREGMQFHRLSFENGQRVSVDARVGFVRDDGTAIVLQSGGGDLLRLAPDASEPQPVDVDGTPLATPVTADAYGATLHGDRLLTPLDGHPPDSNPSLRAIPLRAGVDGWEWPLPDGFARTLWKGYRSFQPWNWFLHPGAPRYVPFFIERPREDEAFPRRIRLVIFDCREGEPTWQSRTFLASSFHTAEDVVRHGTRFAVNLEQLRPPETDDEADHIAGAVAIVDGTTGAITTAFDLRSGGGSRVAAPLAENRFSDDVMYGTQDHRPWALDLDSRELRYGDLVNVVDRVDKLRTVLGALPER